MYLGIRVDAVEEIVNRFLASTFASPEFMRFTETIGTSYMVLSDSKENYIQIESETELGNAIEEMINLIKNKGEIFFKKHKDLGVVNSFKKDQILSDDMGNTHVIHNLMQSLTLTKLCNDPDFDKLKEKYKELYVPFVGEEVTGRKALNDLIEYLQAYNPEKRSQS